MNNRITALFVALVMAFSMLSLNPAPASAAPYVPPVSCVNKVSSDSKTTGVPGLIDNVKVTVRVYYKRCTNKLGPNFAKPTKVYVSTDFSGSRMGCSNGRLFTNGYPGHFNTQFSTYFKNALSNRAFRISRFSIPCSSDTFASGSRNIGKRAAKSLVYTSKNAAGSPVWKSNFEIDWRGGRSDPKGTVGGKLLW